MKLAVRIPFLLLVVAAISGPPEMRAQAISYELEEIRRLAGQLEDLRAAYEAQQRKITSLQREVDSLRGALRKSVDETNARLGDAVTRKDLKVLAEAIEEVDRKRESDRNLILEEIKKELSRVATLATSRKPDPKPEPAQPLIEGTFYSHTVQAGENLTLILDAYNARFREQGKGTVSLTDVKRANPNININRIYVGQEIMIPAPPESR